MCFTNYIKVKIKNYKKNLKQDKFATLRHEFVEKIEKAISQVKANEKASPL
jgi:hypothetical protein